MSDITFPNISIETAAGVREIPLSVYHRNNRCILLDGEINMEMSNQFLLTMLYYEQEQADKSVNVYLNSSGGQVRAGLMIIDVLKHTKLTVNLICCGIGYSMAAVILSTGQPGRRFAFENASLMIHEPLITGGVGGSATNIREISESILATREKLNTILAEHTGKSLEAINEATSRDNYMTPEEAVQFGLIDHILNAIAV